MADGFAAPRGTQDILPPASARWSALLGAYAAHVERAGYGLVVSPMFEDVGVFQRIGDATDIVTKEMYVFEDRGGRTLALRPEGTASVVRAYLQHRPPLPFKAWYVGPHFRYERAQAGRYRQHHQVGLEAIGVLDPDLDVEVVALAWSFVRSLGLTQVRLLVNTLGDPESRAAYRAALVAHLEPHRDRMGETDQQRLATNPLRVLDTKDPEMAEIVDAAPQAADHLTPDAAAHFERVQQGLTDLGVPYELAPRLVRGLDYYTHTLFELAADALASAQNAIGGGGRYDGLAESLGGPATPGIGFGLGIERMLLACDAEGVFTDTAGRVEVFVVDVTDGTAARSLTHELRGGGIGADRAYEGRSMKAQLKAADRSGAAIALIVGEDETARGVVTVRDLATGEQSDVPRVDAVDAVGRLLAQRDGSNAT